MKKIKEILRDSLFNSFRVKIPDTQLNKYQLDSATKIFVFSTFKTLILISILFIIAQIYYFFSDLASGFFSSGRMIPEYHVMGLIAEILILITSGITLCVTAVALANKDQNVGFQKAIITFYYTSVTVGCCLFIIAKTLRYGGLMNTHSSLIYIILLLAVAPAYTRRQNFVYMSLLCLSIIIPAIIVKSNPEVIAIETDLDEINGLGWVFNSLIFIIFGALVSQYTYASSMRSKLKSVVLTEANELLKQKTETDELTQVANRRAMKMYIDLKETEWKALEEDGVAFLMLDIDFFKKYNDFYGHLRGDECLKRVAQAASLAAQQFNGTVYRYGGEEFVVIAENVDEAQALQLCKEIHREIGKLKISHEGINGSKETMLTVSIGLNYETSFKRASSQWILDADQQLYYAKHEGRNCTAYRNALYNTYHKPAKGEEAKRD
ncbi:MAG: diguanylate cyclase [Acholeplasmatales bacterium]|nr:diguanylate cyclase [Acholeplasmatales bacterium]